MAVHRDIVRGHRFPLDRSFHLLYWWPWKEGCFSHGLSFFRVVFGDERKVTWWSLTKICNTLCGDQLRPGPPSILLKVKNWQPPDFHKSFVTQLLEPFTFSVSGKYTKKALPSLIKWVLVFHTVAPCLTQYPQKSVRNQNIAMFNTLLAMLIFNKIILSHHVA